MTKEHICPECGRKQYIGAYESDPEFVTADALEVMDDCQGSGIRFEVGVKYNEYFECMACGYVKEFDEDIIETGETVTCIRYDTPDVMIDRLTMEFTIKMAIERFATDHDPEDYL